MMKIVPRMTNVVVLTAVASLLGAAVTLADAPGSYFMMFPEGMAMVVDATGKATRAKISEETAKEITAGAQPMGANGIVLLYQGKLYIVPDKPLADGEMMSAKVMAGAPASGSGTSK